MKHKKIKLGCTISGNRKTWVAANDIGSITASIIDGVTIIQNMVV